MAAQTVEHTQAYGLHVVAKVGEGHVHIALIVGLHRLGNDGIFAFLVESCQCHVVAFRPVRKALQLPCEFHGVASCEDRSLLFNLSIVACRQGDECQKCCKDNVFH